MRRTLPRIIICIVVSATLLMLSGAGGGGEAIETPFFIVNQDGLVVTEAPSDRHEISVFIFPPLREINWESPSALLRSVHWNFRRNLFRRDHYLIGHLAVGLSSPLLEGPVITGMTSADSKERTVLVMDEMVGLSILGAPMRGTMETSDELLRMINVHHEREMLGILTFGVTEAGMRRVITFLEIFNREDSYGHRPSDHYGGAFWPRYYREGSGCSAFAAAILDVAGVLPADTTDWIVRRNIDIELAGGIINRGRKIPNYRIMRRSAWHSGQGEPNVDFVKVSLYDPEKMYKWIDNYIGVDNDTIRHFSGYGIKGIYFDRSASPVDTTAPIFMERPEPNLFIDHFMKDLPGGQ